MKGVNIFETLKFTYNIHCILTSRSMFRLQVIYHRVFFLFQLFTTRNLSFCYSKVQDHHRLHEYSLNLSLQIVRWSLSLDCEPPLKTLSNTNLSTLKRCLKFRRNATGFFRIEHQCLYPRHNPSRLPHRYGISTQPCYREDPENTVLSQHKKITRESSKNGSRTQQGKRITIKIGELPHPKKDFKVK